MENSLLQGNKNLKLIHYITWIGLVLHGVSLLGCMFVVACYCLYKELRTFAYELVLNFSVTCLLYHATTYIPVQDVRDTYCALQAFLSVWFEISYICWGTIIAYSVYLSIHASNYIDESVCTLRVIFYLIAIGLPASLASLILVTDTYGFGGGFCFMDFRRKDKTTVEIIVIVLYFACWSFIFMNLYYITKTIWILKREFPGENELLEKYESKLRWYPRIQVIFMLPATLNRTYMLITMKGYYPFLIAQIIGDSISGIALSLVYGLTPSVKSAIRNSYYSFRGRRKPSETINNPRPNMANSFVSTVSRDGNMTERPDGRNSLLI